MALPNSWTTEIETVNCWLQQSLFHSITVTVMYQRFAERITLANVKGAGHSVAMDRPAPTLQMMYNFVNVTTILIPFTQLL